ncbi:MAG: molybdopterin-dependent oxidoreductase [Xanthobacteraceae bacterium]|nr:molybdopterin-dependent oxidoreductase [Xanthobacteraceae bacterium]QYK45670.1 MAG: molybdopterin-dependent oxidoreductase [Xanthobacteraceae bacterium]
MSGLREVGKRHHQAGIEMRVRGSSVYTHDVALPGMLFGAILRSPHPHAKILSVDTSAARKLLGVHAVITSEDFKDRRYYQLGGSYSDRRPLAKEKVRFWGEEVAAVAAETLAIAEQACSLIAVEYQVLAPTFTPDDALGAQALEIHGRENAPAGKNLAIRFSANYGNVAEALSKASFVLEDEFQHGIVAPACMETNGTVADFNSAEGKLDLWTATQAPYFIRKEVAHVVGLDEKNVRIRAVEVGGGFGGKSKICEQEALAAMLSIKAKRPVKITLNRHEEFISGKTDHAKRIKIKTAVAEDGRILNRHVSVQIDNGAYTAYAPTYVGASRQRTTCLYRVDTAHYDCDLVYTNKVPGGQYRGMGAPHTIWAIESHMDEIALRLNRDPLEYRIAQANQSGDVTPLKWRITTCGLTECLQEAGRIIGWDEKREASTAMRGVGIASMIHPSGGVIYQEGNFSNSRIELTADGRLIVHTQTADTGTWQNTTLAQIAAEALGVSTKDVSVSHMDTDEAPADLGSAASRVTFVTGNATLIAAENLKAKIIAGLSRQWNCGVPDIALEGGIARQTNEPDRAADLREIARIVGRLDAEGYFSTPGERPDPKTGEGNYAATYVFGAQAAEVEVDRNTGRISVLRMAVAQDVGRALNPTAVEGQIYGGVLQGIGMALQEEMVFEEGRPVNASFLDYAVPRIGSTPQIDISLVETNDPLGPYGAKAGAEPTINATIAAIANAVFHATGIRFKELPMSPDRVLAALEKKDGKKPALKPWKRPYNAEVATVRAMYPDVVFPALRKVGTKFARVPQKSKRPRILVPNDTSELLDLLSNSEVKTRIVAGGTDIFVGLRQGIYDPDQLIDVSHLSEMQGISLLQSETSTLRIGAATSLDKIANNTLAAKHFPSLVTCINLIATPQIRRVATIAGDLCQEKRCWFFRSALPCYKLGGPTCPCFAVLGDNRHHSINGAKRCAAPNPSDLAPLLSSLNARAKLIGAAGVRYIPVEDLYLWSGLTKVGRGEVVEAIEIPLISNTTASFEKFGLRQGDFAEASVAVQAQWSSSIVRSLRIFAGAVSPLPLRAEKAEALLIGTKLEENIVAQAAATIVEGSLPLHDNHYKVPLLINLTKQALLAAKQESMTLPKL